MAARKSFIENGGHADPIGSNPHSHSQGLDFSEYIFSWGSQNAVITKISAMDTLINKTEIRLITLSWGKPKLTDWKPVVLINAKRV